MQPTIPVCSLPLPNKIPAEGTIPRCRHSVFFPSNGTRNKPGFNVGLNPNCGLCVAFGSNPADPARFKMPPFGKSQNKHDALHANAHDPRHFCPTCGSGFRVENQEEGSVKCADCGEQLKAASKRKRALRPLAHIRTIPAR